jgi:AcrR family transcriptional regulator
VTSPTLSPASAAGGHSLRRDAERNRVRIITAAQEVFAAQGLSAGLNDIAHHAGVGVGTAYRRFPDKDALIEAALHDQIDLMIGVANEAMAAERAWDGLLFLLDRGLALLATNLGLREIALNSGGHERQDSALQRFIPFAEALVERAEAEGDMRAGVTVEDFIILQCMISEVARHSVGIRPDAWRRYMQLLMDGLRAHPDAAPLSGALDRSSADAIALRWVGPR